MSIFNMFDTFRAANYNSNMDIQKYLSNSIENMMKDAVRASKGNWFMVKFGVSSRLAAMRRAASDCTYR